MRTINNKRRLTMHFKFVNILLRAKTFLSIKEKVVDHVTKNKKISNIKNLEKIQKIINSYFKELRNLIICELSKTFLIEF